MPHGKQCTKCSTEKPADAFSADRSKRDGLRPTCKDCDRARRRASGTVINEKRRVRYWANVDEERERARNYAREHASEQRERSREYRARNADKLNEAAREWRQANPDRVRANNQRRRALQRDATVEPFTHRDMLRDWEDSDLYGCFYCGSSLEKGYEVNHFDPLSKGGAHTVANLVPSCKPCNGAKNAGDPWAFLASSLAGMPTSN